MSKKYVLFFAQIVFYVAVIWFVAKRFSELTEAVNIKALANQPFYTLLSMLCFLTFYAFLSVHWERICSKYKKYPQRYQWLAFFASQPFKYLPSSIFTFSSRAVYAKKLGLPIKQSSFAQIIENLNILIGGFSAAILFLAFDISMKLGLLVIAAGILAWVGARFIPKIKIPNTAYLISGKEWSLLFLLSFIAWCFAGTAFYFLSKALNIEVAFASAVGANALAMTLGIVAVFAPGGIGVREYIYNKFGMTNTLIIMWRLLTVIIDVVVGIAAIITIGQLSKRSEIKLASDK